MARQYAAMSSNGVTTLTTKVPKTNHIQGDEQSSVAYTVNNTDFTTTFTESTSGLQGVIAKNKSSDKINLPTGVR